MEEDKNEERKHRRRKPTDMRKTCNREVVIQKT